MTELQFQKRISNDKNELIFHFCAIDNNWNHSLHQCAQFFCGDVIVNLTTKKFYISKRALTALKYNYAYEVERECAEKIQELYNTEELQTFVAGEQEKRVIAMLFETCEKLKSIIC